MSGDVLVRVVAPHFVAGIVARDGVVVRAAPILRRRVLGKNGREVAACCAREGWTWEVVR